VSAIALTASKSPLDAAANPQLLELARDPQLLLARHRRAGALLAVAQRSVENDQSIAGTHRRSR
jgi:hypothetical protein